LILMSGLLHEMRRCDCKSSEAVNCRLLASTDAAVFAVAVVLPDRLPISEDHLSLGELKVLRKKLPSRLKLKLCRSEGRDRGRSSTDAECTSRSFDWWWW